MMLRQTDYRLKKVRKSQCSNASERMHIPKGFCRFICNQNRNFLRKVARLVVRFPLVFLLLPCIFCGGVSIFNYFPIIAPHHRSSDIEIRKTFGSCNPLTFDFNKLFNNKFPDTPIRLGDSRTNAKVLLQRRNKKTNLLDRPSCESVLNLHRSIISFKVDDASNNITFKDVCIKSSSLNEEEECLYDPLITFCQKVTEKNLFPQLDRLDRTGEIFSSELGNSTIYLDVRTKFDNVSSQYKADLMRISYFLNENERASHENSLWLSAFEQISKTFNSSEQFETLFVTSQLADKSWKSWSEFNLLHLIILCGMSFLFCFVLSVLYECTIYTCFFHGFQSTLSLAFILGSIFSVKNFVFGKFSDYNINLVMVLVTISHISSQTSFITSYMNYLKKSNHDTEDDIITSEIEFVKTCEKLVVEGFSSMSRYAIMFLVAALTSQYPPFRNLALTCAFSFGMVLLFHTTYIPACFKLHRSCFLCCDDSTWTSDLSSLDSEYTRKEFERDENDLSKKDLESCQDSTPAKLKPNVNYESNFFKSFILRLQKGFVGYTNTLVTVHVRPFIMIIYVVYISFVLISCLNFTEKESEIQLATDKSNWLEYLRKSVEFSPKIVISGRSRQEPWSKDNFLIIAKAHKQIINSNQPHAVYSTVETNWFHAYINELRKEDEKTKNHEQISPTENIIRNQATTQPFSFDLVIAGELAKKSKSHVAPVVKDISEVVANMSRSTMNTSWFAIQKDIDVNTYVLSPKWSCRPENSTGCNETWWYFRLFYHTHDTKLSSTKSKLAASITNLPSMNTEEIELFGDAPILDWWRTIGMGRFFYTIITLLSLNLLVFVGVLLSGSSYLVHVWNIVTSWSVGFGVVATMSFLDTPLDSQTLTCVLFAISYVSQVVWKQFVIFKTEERLQGRARRSEISTYQSAIHIFLSSMILISSNFLFGFSNSPLVTSIRCTLLSLAFLVAMHTYIILPVLLTLAPPSTRPRRVRVAQMFPSTSCSQMKRTRPKRQHSRISNSRSVQSRRSDPMCRLVTNVPRVVVKDETSL